jgi:hypothetical protein
VTSQRAMVEASLLDTRRDVYPVRQNLTGAGIASEPRTATRLTKGSQICPAAPAPVKDRHV